MKNLFLAATLFLISAPAARAQGKGGDLGVGVVIGDATGPTFKYFTSNTTAIDVGLGFSSDFEAYADYLWHGWDIFPRPQQGLFGAYVGVGPRYKERKKDDDFGLRTIAGVDYWIEQVPFEIFLEGGPWFIFTPDTDTELDLEVGVRYYFCGWTKPTGSGTVRGKRAR